MNDKQSHYIQNEIDLVINMINGISFLILKEDRDQHTQLIKTKLENLRDYIPCSCGEEYD